MARGDRINQSQFFDLITKNELGWQNIIFDLIKTEQLDPWDIDIALLADKYVETIKNLEDSDFFISSKVLLACSLLLRLKSDRLANQYIADLNDLLYGKKEVQSLLDVEKFSIDEDILPILIPKTPLARQKKVTLDELMNALNYAINTENRRIKKEIKVKQAEKSALVILPKDHVPLTERIKKIQGLLVGFLNNADFIDFDSLAKDRTEKIASFLPLLQLSNDNKIYLWQPICFGTINITKHMHPDEKKCLDEELEAII